ncbi:ABC transporter ATP-binding protein [Kroppenstedtia pulmonis]|uniref:ABC transporter ATP-binding protein n=1 Tax=Kroppenstedtia pulmonis TaxID=1380685 RepID=A0A7D3Y1N0_9BACL|nr:ABC transporter ATP-binding protein [Kroppenstedtia pulmonis]QKG85460.1 ABC transporter ATP-binding protein [Kroppenstedtia pulmonis]
MIQVHNLVKEYNGTRVVDQISFQVEKGEIFGLLGPNGAGKTTTMEMVEGLRQPDGGEIKVDGIDGVRERSRIKEVIGIQLQSTALFEHLTVKEIIQLYGSFYPRMRSVDELLQSFDLEKKAKTWVKHLSGGQRQRLAIAIAVVHDPKVIFLDEPTTGLDPKARRSLWDVVIGLRDEGRTIFLSTHYMEEAEQLCDRVAIMDSGKIKALDSPTGLIRDLASDSVVEFLSAEAESEEFHHLEGVKQVEQTADGNTMLLTDHLQGTLRGLIHLADQKGWTLSGLRTRTATLEDVFLQRTGKRLTDE